MSIRQVYSIKTQKWILNRTTIRSPYLFSLPLSSSLTPTPISKTFLNGINSMCHSCQHPIIIIIFFFSWEEKLELEPPISILGLFEEPGLAEAQQAEVQSGSHRGRWVQWSQMLVQVWERRGWRRRCRDLWQPVKGWFWSRRCWAGFSSPSWLVYSHDFIIIIIFILFYFIWIFACWVLLVCLFGSFHIWHIGVLFVFRKTILLTKKIINSNFNSQIY